MISKHSEFQIVNDYEGRPSSPPGPVKYQISASPNKHEDIPPEEKEEEETESVLPPRRAASERALGREERRGGTVARVR